MKGVLLAAGVPVGLLVLITGSVAGGCGSPFTAGPSDSGTGDGPSFDGSLDGTGGGEGGGPDGAPTGATVYVSPNGNDSNSGLSPTSPKVTVAAGLTLAKKLGGVPTVKVCAASGGTSYAQSSTLSVTFDVNLQGGFDCTFTTQNTSATPTVLQGAMTLSGATLLLGGTGVTSHTTVKDFGIVGGGGSAETEAVEITGGASPLLTNDLLLGGSGTAATGEGWGSIGLRVDGGSPEVMSCVIGGGNGTGAAMASGSAGILVASPGNPNLHEDIVSGGAGTTPSTNYHASAGLVVQGANVTTAVSTLYIVGNDAEVADAGNGAPAAQVAGVFVTSGSSQPGNLKLQGSIVLGGASTVATTGVEVGSGGQVTLSADRIYGGLNAPTTTGVLVTQAAQFTLVNSEVHGGNSATSTGDTSIGVDLRTVPKPLVEFDTIYAGSATSRDISVSTGATGAILRDNVLVGRGGTSTAVYVAPGTTTPCKGIIAALESTAFSNFENVYECAGAGTDFTISSFCGDLNTGITCLGEVQIGDGAPQPGGTGNEPCVPGSVGGSGSGPGWTCVAEPTCPGNACLTTIFGSAWGPDGNYIFAAPAADGGTVQDWAVASTFWQVNCGGQGQSGVTTDLTGAPRSMTGATSMGAAVTKSMGPDGGTCP